MRLFFDNLGQVICRCPENRGSRPIGGFGRIISVTFSILVVRPWLRGEDSREEMSDGENFDEETCGRHPSAFELLLRATSDEFQPASTNVWGAQYPRVDSREGLNFASRHRTQRQ